MKGAHLAEKSGEIKQKNPVYMEESRKYRRVLRRQLRVIMKRGSLMTGKSIVLSVFISVSLIILLCLAAAAQSSTDTKTMGDAMLQELLRHKPVKFDNSPLAKFYPRSSIAAGAAEKIANKFVEQNGSKLGFMLTESAQPSGTSGNAYVNSTMGGGNQSLEAKLAQKITASPGNLMPDQVMGMSLDVCGGDYWLATLTAHNLLKEVTYAERSGTQSLIGWDNSNMMNSKKWQLINPSSVTGKLRNIRPSGDKFASDKMGPWYHMYGLFFIGGMTSGSEAEFLAWMENVTRKLGLGSSEDPFKMDMNKWAAGLSHSLNALVAQGLYVPANLSTMSKAELQTTFDMLKAKHRALQGELEIWSGLVNHPNIGESAVWQMDVIRNQQKAIYKEAMRLRAELNARPK